MSTSTDTERTPAATTTVTVRATGHVREALGTHELEFTFGGDRLRDFLAALFAEHEDLAALLIAETDDGATARGWAEPPDTLPGTWRKNPEGERARAYARVCVNGTFNELLDGFDTELSDGDRVSLIYPFLFCC